MKLAIRFMSVLLSLTLLNCGQTDEEIFKEIPEGKKLSELSAPLQEKAKKLLRKNLKSIYGNFNIPDGFKVRAKTNYDAMMVDDEKLKQAIGDNIIKDVIEAQLAFLIDFEFEKPYENLIERADSAHKDPDGVPTDADLKKEYLEYRKKMLENKKAKLGVDESRLAQLEELKVIYIFQGYLSTP